MADFEERNWHKSSSVCWQTSSEIVAQCALLSFNMFMGTCVHHNSKGGG